jgi:hypothetical protein
MGLPLAGTIGAAMGVDTKAVLYAGVKIDPMSFFYDKEETEVAVCEHAEAEGKKFCPSCGLTVDERTETKVMHVLKAQFKGGGSRGLADVMSTDEDDDEYVDQGDMWSYVSASGLEVIDVQGYDSTMFTVLGVSLGKTGSSNSYGKEIVTEPLSDTESKMADLRARLTRLNVTAEPAVFLQLAYC